MSQKSRQLSFMGSCHELKIKHKNKGIQANIFLIISNSKFIGLINFDSHNIGSITI